MLYELPGKNVNSSSERTDLIVVRVAKKKIIPRASDAMKSYLIPGEKFYQFEENYKKKKFIILKKN